MLEGPSPTHGVVCLASGVDKLFAHVYLLAQKGIFIIENLNLEELATDARWEFGFVGAPLKFKGATGSPLRPLALV